MFQPRKFSPSRCPITDAFLRDFEAEFGPVERVYMAENGVVLGEPMQDVETVEEK